MGRQYQSFRLQLLSPTRQYGSGLGAVVGIPVYRNPRGTNEILTRDQFVLKYDFEPTEEFLVADPAYNTPVNPPDVLRGAPSLQYVQPDLFAKDATTPPGIIKPPVGWIPSDVYDKSFVKGFVPDIPKEIIGTPLEKIPIDNPEYPGNSGLPGSPVVPRYPVTPPGAPPVFQTEPPPIADRRTTCCIPTCAASPCDSKEPTIMGAPSAVATAYGGQSIVNIGSPGAVTGTSAGEGSYMTAPAPSGYVATGDFSAGQQPVGFLAMIQPQTGSDWVKLLIGVVAGVYAAKWWKKGA